MSKKFCDYLTWFMNHCRKNTVDFVEAKATVTTVFAVFVCLAFSWQSPVFAQGMSEYGGLMGSIPKPGKQKQDIGAGANKIGNYLGAMNSGTQGGSHGGASSAGTHTIGQGKSAGSLTGLNKHEAKTWGKAANEHFLKAQQLEKASKIKEAIRQYQQSLLIREKGWGNSDRAIPVILERLVVLSQKLNDWPEAETYLRKKASLSVRTTGAASLADLKLLAQLCAKQNKQSDQISALSQAVQVMEKHPDKNPQLFAERLELAKLCLLAGQTEIGTSLLQKNYQVSKAKQAPGTEDSENANLLMETLAKTGQTERAQELKANLSTWTAKPAQP